jgi:hypothetical protein
MRIAHIPQRSSLIDITARVPVPPTVARNEAYDGSEDCSGANFDSLIPWGRSQSSAVPPCAEALCTLLRLCISFNLWIQQCRINSYYMQSAGRMQASSCREPPNPALLYPKSRLGSKLTGIQPLGSAFRKPNHHLNLNSICPRRNRLSLRILQTPKLLKFKLFVRLEILPN